MPPPAAERLGVGQHISLSGTLFDDFVGTVQSIDAKDRICVLLELMQRTVKLVVPFDNVVAMPEYPLACLNSIIEHGTNGLRSCRVVETRPLVLR